MEYFTQRKKLLKGLISGEFAYIGPFNVLIDVTRRCNLRCPGCRFHSPEIHMPTPGDQSVMDMDFDMFRKLCEDLSCMNARELTLLGEGEALLNSRIFDMIATVKKSGLKVRILTNGTLFDKTNVQQLINSQLDGLKVSPWATSREDYEQQHPGTDPKYFDRVVEGLKLLDSLKKESSSRFPAVTLHYPINRINFTKINNMLELALSTGCNAISFAPFRSIQGALKEYLLSPAEEKAICFSLKQMKRQLKSLPLSHNIDRVLWRYQNSKTSEWKSKPPCYIGWVNSRVRVDGTVTPCGRCDIALGNLGQNSFHEIWNNTAYRAFRKQAVTHAGLAALDSQCVCEYCCFTADNVRVHRAYKWLAPVARHLNPVFRKTPVP